jgi:hypothetical protein
VAHWILVQGQLLRPKAGNVGSWGWARHEYCEASWQPTPLAWILDGLLMRFAGLPTAAFKSQVERTLPPLGQNTMASLPLQLAKARHHQVLGVP